MRIGIVAMSTRKVNTVDDGWKKVISRTLPHVFSSSREASPHPSGLTRLRPDHVPDCKAQSAMRQ